MLVSTVVSSLIMGQIKGSPSLTVYNGGFAIIREEREFNLARGEQEVAVSDVAAMIETNSVSIRSLSHPNSISVLEQNYQYDLINPMAILNKAVGQQITFNRVHPDGSREKVIGTLLSSPTQVVGGMNGGNSMTYNGMVIKTDDGRIILNPSGEIEVSSIPNGLISKPTLMWLVNSARAGQNTVELAYISQGFSWNADYVLAMDREGKTADLKGWVTMNNASGATFADANLKLLAGEVFRAPKTMNQRNAPAGFGGGGLEMADSRMIEETFSEYHLYSLPRKTTIRDKEVKQLNLLQASGVKTAKRLVFDPLLPYISGYRPNDGEIGTGNQNPFVYIDLVNVEENNMGMPLPAGNFKVFQPDSSGALQLVGEDKINHTPRKEKISLKVGKSFDVVGTRTRKKFEWLRNRFGMRQEFEIEIRNRRKEDIYIELIERHFWESDFIKTSDTFTHPESNTWVYPLNIKADSTKTVSFIVETYWT